MPLIRYPIRQDRKPLAVKSRTSRLQGATVPGFSSSSTCRQQSRISLLTRRLRAPLREVDLPSAPSSKPPTGGHRRCRRPRGNAACEEVRLGNRDWAVRLALRDSRRAHASEPSSLSEVLRDSHALAVQRPQLAHLHARQSGPTREQRRQTIIAEVALQGQLRLVHRGQIIGKSLHARAVPAKARR